MQLPALKNAVPASLVDGMSIEDFIRNSHPEPAAHVRGDAAAAGVAGAVYLGFDGTTGAVEAQPGAGRREDPRPHPGAAARPVRRLSSNGPTRRRCRRSSGSCSASITTSRCLSGCCRSRCRPMPTGRKPTARPTCSASSASCSTTAPRSYSSTPRWAARRRSAPWRRPPPRRSSPSARSSTR